MTQSGLNTYFFNFGSASNAGCFQIQKIKLKKIVASAGFLDLMKIFFFNLGPAGSGEPGGAKLELMK